MSIFGRLMGGGGTALAFLTAATAVTAYILWGPAPPVRSRSRKRPVGALLNLGTTCYLNSVLQAIASSHYLLHWLGHHPAPQRSTRKLSNAVYDILCSLNGQKNGLERTLNPGTVLNALGRQWEIPDGEQDAYEMLHVLMTSLEEDQSEDDTERGIGLESLLATSNSQRIDPLPSNNFQLVRPRVGENYIAGNRPSAPFKGLLGTRLRCLSCGYQNPITVDAFQNLSLNLPAPRFGVQRFTLQDCLENFFKKELLEDVKCEACTKEASNGDVAHGEGDSKKPAPEIKSSFTKFTTILKYPECLFLHLQRTVWNRGQSGKRAEFVEFPLNLDLAPLVLGCSLFCHSQFSKSRGSDDPAPGNINLRLLGGAPNSSDFAMGQFAFPVSTPEPVDEEVAPLQPGICMYSLSAVIVHVGDAKTGHFVTYRRGPSGTEHHNDWYYCSDECVRPASLKEVMNVSAYMLVYNRTRPSSELIQ